jgi:hypothetical protein
MRPTSCFVKWYTVAHSLPSEWAMQALLVHRCAAVVTQLGHPDQALKMLGVVAAVAVVQAASAFSAKATPLTSSPGARFRPAAPCPEAAANAHGAPQLATKALSAISVPFWSWPMISTSLCALFWWLGALNVSCLQHAPVVSTSPNGWWPGPLRAPQCQRGPFDPGVAVRRAGPFGASRTPGQGPADLDE